jgi:hypothetical protein
MKKVLFDFGIEFGYWVMTWGRGKLLLKARKKSIFRVPIIIRSTEKLFQLDQDQVIVQFENAWGKGQ